MSALLVEVFLTAAEVHQEDLVLLLPESHQKISRLYIVVD